MQINSDQCQEIFWNYTEMIVTFSLHIEKSLTIIHKSLEYFCSVTKGKMRKKTNSWKPMCVQHFGVLPHLIFMAKHPCMVGIIYSYLTVKETEVKQLRKEETWSLEWPLWLAVSRMAPEFICWCSTSNPKSDIPTLMSSFYTLPFLWIPPVPSSPSIFGFWSTVHFFLFCCWSLPPGIILILVSWLPSHSF